MKAISLKGKKNPALGGIGGNGVSATSAQQSAFEQSHELDVREICLELVIIILVLQPGPAIRRWTAVEDETGRSIVVFNPDDRPLEPVGINFLDGLPGIQMLDPWFPGADLSGLRVFKIGVAPGAAIPVFLFQELAQELDRSSR